MRLEPGATIGIIGGGQLGRMLSMAAARLGYRCAIFDPHEHPPAAAVAAGFTRAAFNDREALADFARTCDVITYEFENLAVEPLAAIANKLRPGIASLETAQDRVAEKRFIEACGATPAEWRAVDGAGDIRAAADELGLPLIVKTRRFGYDGKGQVRLADADAAETAWADLREAPSVAEKMIDFSAEYSVIVARSSTGTCSAFPIARNDHQSGILRRSTAPATEPEIVDFAEQSVAIASRIAEQLGHIGVLTVEFFATAQGPLVNEIAPRVHNSGHWTIEGAFTSQFEQHIRAICDLPLGDPGLVTRGARMDNLIGDDVFRWQELVAERGAFLHLYGKDEPRPGRKMGHVTRLSR